MREEPLIHIVKPPVSAGTEAKWLDFLHQHPGGGFFQSPGFLPLYDGCKNYQPLVLIAENLKEEITGVLVAVIISERIYGVPFQRILIQGGPVIAPSLPGRAEVLRALLQTLKQHVSRRTVFVEIRNLHQWDEEADVFRELGFEWHDHLNDILQIHSKNKVFAEIKPAKQRQIRRGFENGAIIRPAESAGEVEAFYQLLKDLYKTKVRKPLPPLTFFLNFYQKIQLENKGVILVVIYKDAVIGGMVCPFSGLHTIHEWYICSLQDRLKHLYPGVLATWAGIDFAIRHKFRYFDFMGIGSPQKPYGVRNFKTKFGGEIINYGRWQLINNKFRYNLGILGYKLLNLGSKP
ncbi:MAG: peptidoglycan bridge formation glycyltransferase FemA/FemB family protein [Bacteroidetes bacterium]|nr:peptidoglycan bridge formation glycyltransferase FemA/FemB family protein [Bacteroidota bacterium]